MQTVLLILENIICLLINVSRLGDTCPLCLDQPLCTLTNVNVQTLLHTEKLLQLQSVAIDY